MDQESYEVRYGPKLEAQGHIVGPWDCTRIDKRVTLEGWEGFMAVEEVEYQDGQNEKTAVATAGMRKDSENPGPCILIGTTMAWRGRLKVGGFSRSS